MLRWSYVRLAEEIRRTSAQPAADAAEFFRRVCFNALISNTDDHPRNHALIALDRAWKLSPAYDLTPAKWISIERRDLAMAAGDAGHYANAENILSQCLRFLLKREAATHVIKELKQQVHTTWYKVARGAGVSERDCGVIAGAFAYPGFDLPLPSI